MKYADSVQFRTPDGPSIESLEAFIKVCQDLMKLPNLQKTTSAGFHTTVWAETNQHVDLLSFIRQLGALADRLNSSSSVRLQWVTITWQSKGQAQGHGLTIRFSSNDKELTNAVTLGKMNNVAASVSDALYEAVAKYFPAVSPRNPRLAGLPDELRQFHLEQEKIFADREQRLLAGYDKLQTAIEEAQKSADSRVIEAQKKFDDSKATLVAEFAEKEAELKREWKKLEEARKQFDDRQRMHARRKHEEVLKELVQKQQEFAVSETTGKKRRIVWGLGLFGMALGIALYVSVAVEVLAYNAPLSAMLWSMLATGTFLVGSTLVFMLRWTNAWFQTHAEFETTALAFNQDFTRASWLVEFLFEWQKENPDKPVPDVFLRTLASRLFEPPGAKRVDHPMADVLANLSHVQSVEMDKKRMHVKLDAGK